MRPRRFAATATGLALAAVAAAAPGSAAAHDVNARLSPSGVEFLEAQLPTYVPTYLRPPAVTVQVADPCPGSKAIWLTQRDTEVYLSLDAFDLKLPQDGTLRVDVTLSAVAWGEAFIENPYFCFGSATCQDELWIDGARAIIDFAAWVDATGKPRVQVAKIDLELSPNQIDFTLSSCPIDDIVNLVVDVGKDWAMDFMLAKVEEMAQQQIGPRLEAMLAGFASYDGVTGSSDFSAKLTSVTVSPSGIGAAVDIDLTSRYPAAACVGADPGDPAPQPGPAPNLAAGVNAHVGLSANLGLVDDALYHVWREGFMCVTPESLGALGISLDLDHIAGLLPGFPAGTTFSLAATVTMPPRVEGAAGEVATLTLVIEGVEIDLFAHTPDGQTRSLHLELDAAVSASVALDPSINALVLEIGDVRLTDLVVEDELGLEEAGFDFARIHKLLEERVLPRLADQLGAMPVTGPVFGGLAGYYAILREVRTTTAYLLAKADLFRAPADDRNPPDTFIAQRPSRPVRPSQAAILVDGTDAEIPTELLRYVVSVDGAAGSPTYVKKHKIGEEGRTATYRVSVAAMDLGGNVDPTPAVADVTVDGVSPDLRLLEYPRGTIATATPVVTWTATDDVTPAEALEPRARIYRIRPDRSGELVDEQDLGAGSASGKLILDPGTEYRVILDVSDEAGNVSSEAFLFTVSPDAPAPGAGCGCEAAGRGGRSPAAAALLLATVVALRLRRRRAA